MILQRLAEYQIWANDETRGLLKELTEEEFSREILPPFGSIRSLCAHITLAIEYNIERHVKRREVDPKGLIEETYKAPMDRLLETWREADEKLLDFTAVNTGEEYVFPNFLREGEIRLRHEDFFSQYLLHTTHHRAQIMSALRLMGKEGRTTDYLFYLSDVQK